MSAITTSRIDHSDLHPTVVGLPASDGNLALALPPPAAILRVHPTVDEPIDAPVPGHQGVKRIVDILVSLTVLILLAPVMIAIALAVTLTSPGGAFFLQERVGQGGRLFRVVKFRSMRSGTHAEVVGDELARRRYLKNDFKLDADDPRITAVGRFIRATSLDELPQLFNVLAGHMSLVGIRPLLELEVALRPEYDQQCYRAMKPGMTGLWQVSGRSSVVSDHRFALDRRYVETWSIRNDLLVLLRTPTAVLRTGQTC